MENNVDDNEVNILKDAVVRVTKRWRKQREAEERNAQARQRRREALVRARQVSFKDAAWEVIPAAYLHASNDQQHPAFDRQVMYAARDDIQEMTGKTLSDQYFCQTLLPDYLSAHPEETADWDVVFDSRGHFHEPHTEKIVPLGTLDVRGYLGAVDEFTVEDLQAVLKDAERFPTLGPLHRYGALAFIEKEGFLPIFQDAQLLERYDIGLLSTKGQSVTACRLLADILCHHFDIPLLVLHDFDQTGFQILGSFLHNTRRYTWKHKIEVIDLGLRLEDIRARGFKSEYCAIRGKNPAANLRKNGATREEIEFLCRNQRVELNAFSAGDLVEWIEGKLQEHGVKKIVPDSATLQAAYRRSIAKTLAEQHLEAFLPKALEQASRVKLPQALTTKVRAALEEDSTKSWDSIISEMAAESVQPGQDE
jgi:hypothetical protein